mgnify:CR=1 FL=1
MNFIAGDNGADGTAANLALVTAVRFVELNVSVLYFDYVLVCHMF